MISGSDDIITEDGGGCGGNGAAPRSRQPPTRIQKTVHIFSDFSRSFLRSSKVGSAIPRQTVFSAETALLYHLVSWLVTVD